MKRAYVISYDLKGPSANYSDLYEFLKSQGNWWHYLASTWIIISDLSASELADEIRRYTNEGDRFLVTALTKETNGWLPKRAWEWIREKMERVAAMQS